MFDDGLQTSQNLVVLDTATYQWNAPSDASDFQEDHPGPRYGHTATLIEMHPPRLMVYGGMVSLDVTRACARVDCLLRDQIVCARYAAS